MLDGDQADHIVDDSVTVADDSVAGPDDGIADDITPACTALVPMVQTTRWSRPRPMPRPSSIFITQLIATAEQDPQTRSLRRASASDANAAYTANRNRPVATGLRQRQIV